MARSKALVTPLKRTAIIVHDLKKSVAFYRDVLGLTEWASGAAGPELPAMYKLLGMPPCSTRWVILQSDQIDWGMVGLFELTDPAPDVESHPRTDRANRGEACLVFHTHDIKTIHRKSAAMGLPILCAPTPLEIKDRDALSIEMTLRDPSGVLINLIQNVRSGKLKLSNHFPGLKTAPNSKPKAKPKAKAKAKAKVKVKVKSKGKVRRASR